MELKLASGRVCRCVLVEEDLRTLTLATPMAWSRLSDGLPAPATHISLVQVTSKSCPSAPCTRWFNAWCRHTGFEYDADRQRVTITKPSDPGPTPGPIDNADLLAEEQRPSKSALTEEEAATVSTLRAGLVEKRDFWAFAPRTWDLLKQWCELC